MTNIMGSETEELRREGDLKLCFSEQKVLHSHLLVIIVAGGGEIWPVIYEQYHL